MTRREQSTYVALTGAASRAGLEPGVVRRCIEAGLVSERLSEADLAALRRIRRLTRLGVNLPGVEVVLRMRGQIERLQAEVARLEGLLACLMSLGVPKVWLRSLPWDPGDTE